jgi:hypothetical protein
VGTLSGLGAFSVSAMVDSPFVEGLGCEIAFSKQPVKGCLKDDVNGLFMM